MSACPWDKLSREPIRAPPSKRKLNGKNWVDSCPTAFGKLKGDSCPSIALRCDGGNRPVSDIQGSSICSQKLILISAITAI